MKRSWLAPLLLSVAAPASAQPSAAIRAELLACGQGVELVSDGARLSQVLGRLSNTLGFEMRYWASEDPPIRIETRRSPLDLMRELSTHANVMVRYRPDSRCPGQLKIGAVWVIPGGAAVVASKINAPLPSAPGAAPAATSTPAPTDPAQTDFLRAHGMLPPLDPAKP